MLTCNPHYDAEVYTYAQDAAAAADEAEAIELANRFVAAAEHGEDEPLYGTKAKSTVGEALYAVNCDRPDLIDAIFYWAARQTDSPVLRAMEMEVGAHWAQMEQGARHD